MTDLVRQRRDEPRNNEHHAERQIGIIDYVAMMADVEIPTEDEEDEHE